MCSQETATEWGLINNTPLTAQVHVYLYTVYSRSHIRMYVRNLANAWPYTYVVLRRYLYGIRQCPRFPRSLPYRSKLAAHAHDVQRGDGDEAEDVVCGVACRTLHARISTFTPDQQSADDKCIRAHIGASSPQLSPLPSLAYLGRRPDQYHCVLGWPSLRIHNVHFPRMTRAKAQSRVAVQCPPFPDFEPSQNGFL